MDRTLVESFCVAMYDAEFNFMKLPTNVTHLTPLCYAAFVAGKLSVVFRLRGTFGASPRNNIPPRATNHGDFTDSFQTTFCLLMLAEGKHS